MRRLAASLHALAHSLHCPAHALSALHTHAPHPPPYQMDVPYIGIVKSCDPREGLYVQFESYEDQEMLITNEVCGQ